MDQPKQQKPKDEKKPVKRLTKWESDKRFRKLLVALKKEIKKSPLTPSPLESIIPDDKAFHRLSEDSLLKMLKDKKLKKASYSGLLSLLFQLRSDFDAEILIKKLAGKFSIRSVLAEPTLLLIKLKGMNPSISLKTQLAILGSGRKSVNIADIRDRTDPGDYWKGKPSQLLNIFGELESKIIPGIIRYTNRKTRKLFLVYIPSNMSMTEFQKIYGRIITKLHADFYGETYRGRPLSHFKNERAILKALKKYRGSHLSLDNLYQIAAKELNVSPDTIKRCYKPIIKRVKEGKIP